MYEGHDQAVAVLLRDAGCVSPATLSALHETSTGHRVSLADTLLARGLLARGELLRRIAVHLGLRFLDELPPNLPPEISGAVPGHLARRFGVIPFGTETGGLQLAAVDPFVPGLAGDLTFALGRDVEIAVADPARIVDLLQIHYGVSAVAEDNQTADRGGMPPPESGEPPPRAGPSERPAGEVPVVRFVNRILSQAIREHASDVHFEPFENQFRVRLRVDGTLRDVANLPAAQAPAVVSRLKVLSGLNIAERRLPQDGRLRFSADGRTVDLRISTLPIQTGESVVLRVLDPTTAPPTLAALGLPGSVGASVQEIIRRPNGILLVTGPTGSGKTTTLYGCLRLINSAGIKILTAEDPVEYEVEGITQLAVNQSIGLTFACALRSFLRHDPDVMMVGEIRDLETAQIASQAALTGHLVLSTLHTNDAAGAVTRLADLGVEPFLICATLEAVLAQRLVRRICPECRERFVPPARLLVESGVRAEETEGQTFFRGRGCSACGHTGYRGRIGVFEWLRVTESIRALILERAPAAAIQRLAARQGMEPLRTAGLRAVFDGSTTVSEFMRYF
jgi:type IV pilus assembly protein PilB